MLFLCFLVKFCKFLFSFILTDFFSHYIIQYCYKKEWCQVLNLKHNIRYVTWVCFTVQHYKCGLSIFIYMDSWRPGQSFQQCWRLAIPSTFFLSLNIRSLFQIQQQWWWSSTCDSWHLQLTFLMLGWGKDIPQWFTALLRSPKYDSALRRLRLHCAWFYLSY